MFVNRFGKLPLVAVLLSSAAASVASADFSQVMFRVDASSIDALGVVRTGSYTALLDLTSVSGFQYPTPGGGYWNPDTEEYNWTLPGDVMITAGDGTVLGGIYARDPRNPNRGTSIFLREDPQIDINFSVFAGDLNTTFTITSSTVTPADPIMNAVGRTSAGFSITDLGGDGVHISGWSGNSIYTSRYNGAVPGGTTFHDHFLGTFGTADPFGTFTTSENNPAMGFEPIGPAVADMSARFRFTLSAGDLASGTSVYEVVPVPTPGAVSVLGLGGLLAMRRRRR